MLFFLVPPSLSSGQIPSPEEPIPRAPLLRFPEDCEGSDSPSPPSELLASNGFVVTGNSMSLDEKKQTLLFFHVSSQQEFQILRNSAGFVPRNSVGNLASPKTRIEQSCFHIVFSVTVWCPFLVCVW